MGRITGLPPLLLVLSVRFRESTDSGHSAGTPRQSRNDRRFASHAARPARPSPSSLALLSALVLCHWLFQLAERNRRTSSV